MVDEVGEDAGESALVVHGTDEAATDILTTICSSCSVGRVVRGGDREGGEVGSMDWGTEMWRRRGQVCEEGRLTDV